MAIETRCLTPGAMYVINVHKHILDIGVHTNWVLADLDEQEAIELENLLHNAIEQVLAAYWVRHKGREDNRVHNTKQLHGCTDAYCSLCDDQPSKPT